MITPEELPTVVVCTSVMVNLMSRLTTESLSGVGYCIAITDHVAKELSDFYCIYFQEVKVAIAKGVIVNIAGDHPNELLIFSKLLALGRLGAGECSTIAVAINQNHYLAVNDCARQQAVLCCPSIRTVSIDNF